MFGCYGLWKKLILFLKWQRFPSKHKVGSSLNHLAACNPPLRISGSPQICLMVSPPFPNKTRICTACKRMLLRLTEENTTGGDFLTHLVWDDSFTCNNWEKKLEVWSEQNHVICMFLHCCSVQGNRRFTIFAQAFTRHGWENHGCFLAQRILNCL